jgi:prepilin-type N-terminal cleavage/methylation domain-containing protein
VRQRVRHAGFTLIEVLIALAIVGVAFAALGFVQVTNLRTSTTSRVVTETKNAANQVLEQLLADVLETESCVSTESWCDDTGTYYVFNDYYWSCPPEEPLPSPDTDISLGVRDDLREECEGTMRMSTPSDHEVMVAYVLAGQPGIAGEGVLAITVTARHTAATGVNLTIGDRVTCFDVYPSPTSQAPAPCPVPTSSGSGRSGG